MAFDTVQGDPDVCENCFRRTHDRWERNYVVDTYYGDIWIRQVDDLSDEVYRRHRETSRMPESNAPRGIITVCDCGQRPFSWEWVVENCDQDPETGEYDIPEWRERPLPKWKFFEYAENLLDRYRESGVSLDEDVWWDELDRLKSDPDEQFADDRIFKKATKYAITVENIRSNRDELARP